MTNISRNFDIMKREVELMSIDLTGYVHPPLVKAKAVYCCKHCNPQRMKLESVDIHHK
jgi:hypothetical protein